MTITSKPTLAVESFNQHQAQLPRLPLPQLDETFAEYLRTLEPLVTPEQFAEAKDHAADFLRSGGQAERLHRRLCDLAARETGDHGNWLYNLATEYEYLKCRTPLLVKIATFTLFRDDPVLSSASFAAKFKQDETNGFTVAQVKRAARLINGFLDINDALEAGRYPVEPSRNGPVCLHQYSMLFGVTRIPMPGCDVLRGAGTVHPRRLSQHVTVMIDSQAYKMPVYASGGARVDDSDLECQLWQVIQQAETCDKLEEPICIFTGAHRDCWTQARECLIDLSNDNVSSLHSIEESLFAVSLDRFSGRKASRGAPGSIIGLDASFRHGLSNGENRWIDKSFSLIIEHDGRAGIMCEHSACDGLVPAIVAAEALQSPVCYLEPAPDTPTNCALPPPKALPFAVDDKIVELLEKARKETDLLTANSDTCALQFRDYGTDFIKKTARLSPDAYLQMAIQLAFFRMHGQVAAACESIGMRGFLKGRTEIGCVLSRECRTWCESMVDLSSSTSWRYQLLQHACRVHKDMQNRALAGRGAIWHMHALKLMYRKGEEPHAVFSDEAAVKSKRWRIYAGSLNSKDTFYTGGFGSVLKDGYGIGYHVRPDALHIGIESDHTCREISSEGFKQALEQSLREMAIICQTVAH